MNTKSPKHNWPKFALQWGSLAALVFFVSGLAAKIFDLDAPNPEAYCPMGGLEALSTYVQRGSLPCSMTTLQIMMGVGVAVAVVLFSKLFCAYLCPVGTIEDLLAKLRKAVKLPTVRIKSRSVPDMILRVVKYGILFWIVFMTVSSSELFCKNLDPYYAVATGFKGEITLWMSIITVSIVLLLGLFIDRFWCRYICPLGAVSNTAKFWVWLVVLFGVYAGLVALGVNISWIVLLAAFCVMGYVLELTNAKGKAQVLRIVKDDSLCSGCGLCNRKCPYAIDVTGSKLAVNDVDCMLCGECVSACSKSALSVGVKKPGCRFTSYLPAILAVVFFVAALLVGNSFELPTIDVTWDMENMKEVETVKIENLKSVKCYGSSMAFKARMEKVRGVHGVKTFVGSHTVVLTYDPTVTTAEKLQEEVFVPSHFRVWSPDPAKLSELKCLTIRTEKMYDKLDLNYLGLQFRQTGRGIFGVESEYDCPLVVHVYVSPNEEFTEDWFREIVELKSLDMPVHGGGIKQTPVDFEFVRMEKGESLIPIKDYLEKMFDPFTAEFASRIPEDGRTQYVYEIANQSYEKPILKRALPFLSNHLSKEDGVIGVYLRLNKDLVPSIQVRYCEPMTSDRIWELMNMETWTITYSKDDVREESARMKFEEPGVTYEWEEPAE